MPTFCQLLRTGVHYIAQPLTLLILAQAAFLTVGISRLDFNVTWWAVILAVVTAAIVELIIANLGALLGQNRVLIFVPRSAIAAALGIGIFFRSDHIIFFAAASALAILSKYVFRIGNKHVYNPSNVAIVLLAFILPTHATIEFTQWGSDPRIYIAVAVISIFIAWRARVLHTTASFLVTYAILFLPFLTAHQNAFASHHYGLMGPSLVLFAAFMITDPKSSPQGFYPGILHGFAVACAYFFLEGAGLQYALFAASFLIASLNGFSNLLRIQERLSSHVRSLNAPNLTSTALILILCFAMYVHLRDEAGVTRFIKPVSPGFFFLGVESEGVRACTNRAALKRGMAFESVDGMNISGAAWGDFDGNGFDDLLLTSYDGPIKLFSNTDGEFTDVTERVGLADISSASGYMIDIDNDGMLEIILLGTSDGNADSRRHAAALSYVDSVFKDVSAKMGFSQLSLPASSSVAATFADLDRDGWLDMILATGAERFEVFHADHAAFRKTLANPAVRQKSQATCQPDDVRNIIRSERDVAAGIESKMSIEDFISSGGCLILQRAIALSDADGGASYSGISTGGIADALGYLPGSVLAYRNVHGQMSVQPRISDIVQSILVQSADRSSQFATPSTHPYTGISGAFFQPVSFDYDGDSLPDIFITVDYGTNLLLRNLGYWHFKDVTAAAGLDYFSNGMGVDVGDPNRDGMLDLVVTNTLEDYVFENTGGVFVNTTANSDFARGGLGWGVSWLDYDLDGKDDIFIGNGDAIRTSESPDGALMRPLFRSDNLYRGNGHGAFEDMTGIDVCADAESARPLAVSDFDNDGDVDVFVGNRNWVERSGSHSALLVNDSSKVGVHYVKIRLRGSRDNTFGLGAEVSVTNASGSQKKIVLGGSSFRSQNSSTLHFGTGPDDTPVKVHVRWPSGDETYVENVEVDQTYEVLQSP